MKKVLILFLCVAFTALTLGLNVKAEEPVGTVRFHYETWDDVYADDSWVHAYDTASKTDVKLTGTDEFGAYYDIPIYASSEDTINLVWVSEGGEGTWGAAQSPDYKGIDVKSIKDETTDMINVYAFVGGTKTDGSGKFLQADPTLKNVIIAYFDATGAYEDTLGVHAWGSWNELDCSWGKPYDVFGKDNGFKTAEDKVGKAGIMFATAEAENASCLVYAGDDATKKHAGYGDITVDLKDVEVGGTKVLYVGSGKVYMGAEQHKLYASECFAFKFIEYGLDESGNEKGTYAADPTSIFVSFSSDIAFTYKVKYTVIEDQVIGYNPVPVEGGKTFDQTDKEQTSFTELPALAEGMAGRIVFHYQKWNGDYTSAGLWTWGSGTGGTANGVTSLGVDSFGAVMDIQFAPDATTVGIIPIKENIEEDNRWDSRETPDGDHINFDVTNRTGEVHLYYFEGGHNNFYETSNDKFNVMIVNYNTDGKYLEHTYFHAWGLDKDVNSPNWGEPITSMTFVKGMGNPNTFDATTSAGSASHKSQGETGIIQSATFKDGGFLLYDGVDNKVTKDNASIAVTDLADLKAGDVRVLYIADGITYYGEGAKAKFASAAFGEVELKEIIGPVEVEKEKDVYYNVEDIVSRFTLKQGEETVAIAGISDEDFEFTAAKAKDILLFLTEDNKLDITKEYTLEYKNYMMDDYGKVLTDKEGNEKLEIVSINLNLDTEKPVFKIQNKEVEVNCGDDWDQTKFPLYTVTDNRDGNITSKVYVEDTEGTVNLGKPGSYKVTLTAFDDWGNEANQTFTVKVVDSEAGSGCNNGTSMIIMSLSLLGAAMFVALKRKY